MWCVAWWHSGREDDDEEDDDDEPGGPESSRTVPGYDETLTPVSLETPVASVISQCDSFSVIHQPSGINLDQQGELIRPSIRTAGHPSSATIANKSISNDSVSIM